MAGSETVQITMPQMGESVSEGTVLTWHKREGDPVEKDETVVEVSTDKVDAEIPAPASGKLVKIVAGEDEAVAVGDTLGEIEVGVTADGGGPEPAAAPAEGEAPASAPSERPAAVKTEEPREAEVADEAKVSPVARRVAAAHGIDI